MQPSTIVATNSRATETSHTAYGAAIVGRARELEALSGLLAGLERGAGFVAVLEGPPGSGKTTLVAHSAADAERRGWRVLRSKAREHGVGEPLAVASSLFGLELRAASLEALSPLADAISDPGVGPVLCIVDDAQWVDSASMPIIRTIGRATLEAPVGVLVALRPTPRSIPVGQLRSTLARLGASNIELGPLPDPEAAALAAAAAHGLSPAQVREVVAASNGNPFLIRELSVAAQDGEEISAASAAWHALELASTTTRVVLDAAAVLGSEVRAADLAAMTRHDLRTIGAALEEAIAIGVLVEPGGAAFEFSHDLFREALYDSLPPSVRVDLHELAATALSARGASKLRVAEHVRRAAVAPDDRAATSLLSAAEEGGRADPAVALGLLEHADELASPDGPIAEAIAEQLIPLLAWSGRAAESIQRARRLLDRTPMRDRQVRIRTRLAEALALYGAEREAGAEALDALELGGGDALDRASLHVVVAVGTWDAQPGVAIEHVAHALRLADEHDLPMVRVWATELRALVHNVTGESEDYARLGEQAVGLATELVSDQRVALAPSYLAWTLTNFGESLVHVERYDDARRAYADAERWIRIIGAERSRIGDILVGRTLIDLCLAQWDDAYTEIETRQELLREFGMSDLSISGVRESTASLTARVACLSGDADAAAANATEWESMTRSPVERARSAGWHAHAALLAGDGDRALAALSRSVAARNELAAIPEGPAAHRALSPLFTGSFALVAAEAGRDDVVRLLAADMAEATLRAPSVAFLRSNADTCRAIAEGDAALARLAAREAESVVSPVLRAAAQIAAANAMAHLRASNTVEAEAALRTCDDHNVGLAPLLRRSTRAPRRPRAQRPATGWESLTPAEVAVALQVATGKSNRQIADELYLSRYTVETHLKHIYRKLRISSRAQLAAHVVERRMTARPSPASAAALPGALEPPANRP